jgi:hypothetical protein
MTKPERTVDNPIASAGANGPEKTRLAYPMLATTVQTAVTLPATAGRKICSGTVKGRDITIS